MPEPALAPNATNGKRRLRRAGKVNIGEKMATIDDFRKLEFRVAEIKDVTDHPGADKLLVLT